MHTHTHTQRPGQLVRMAIVLLGDYCTTLKDPRNLLQTWFFVANDGAVKFSHSLVYVLHAIEIWSTFSSTFMPVPTAYSQAVQI